jgi:serine/threonine protein kinase/tetratricopeptide (TPR) repeat protein
LAAELNARRRLGEQPTPAEYAARCPEHAERISDVFLDLELCETPKTGLDQPVDRAHDTDPGGEPAGAADCPQRLRGYRIESELGRGGMGVVYRAFDEKRGVPVALKTLKEVDSAAILRFKQEFRFLADMSHPNLVVLHELTADGSSWFFTMELVEGVDFLSFVRSGTDRPVSHPETTEDVRPADTIPPGPPESTEDAIGDTESFDAPRVMKASPLPPPARRYSLSPALLARLRIALEQLAEGVAFLHAAGTLHRDLKPSNVLVTRTGRVVIVDFGLAADIGASGLHQSLVPYILGTSAYMAPEQAAGLPVSPASDWYSLGSMLYEVLTGHPPFLGRPHQVRIDKLRLDPPAPSELVPGVPDDLNVLCVDLHRRVPGERPTGRDVLLRLGSRRGAPKIAIPLAPSQHQRAPLVGRARDLESLEAAFAGVARGQTVALYIHGPSGVGKTALVRHFLDELIGRDQAVVLAGRCYEQESVPYKALDSVIDALSQYLRRLPLWEARALVPADIRSLVRVFPTLGEAEAVAATSRLASLVPDPQELRRRAFRALRELLARLGDRRTLVLAIDDLQWGDSDSATLLLELLRPPDAPRLLLLGCYRSEEAATSPLLRALLAVEEGAAPGLDRRELALGTLEPADAEALALRLLGHRDDVARAHAAAIARESGGNPFFVAELARYVEAQADPLERVPGADQVALDEVLWWRIGRLPEEARRLLEVVVVSGRPLGQVEASRAAGLGGDERAASNLLRAGRLIRGTGPSEGERIEVYHDRVREAVVARIPPGERAGHHRLLATVLQGTGRADPEVLAVHYHGAGEPGRAATYYAKAAEQAAEALAFDRAAKLYRLALELGAWDEADARRLRIGLGDALANAGRGPDAARAYLVATPGTSAALAFELHRRAALQYLSSGLLDEGLAELRAVLGSVGLSFPSTPWRALLGLVRARIRLRLRGLHHRPREADRVPAEDLRRIDACWTAGDGLGLIDTLRGAYFQACGLLHALRAGEPYRLARSLAFEMAHVGISGGRSARRVEGLRRVAEEMARRLDDHHTWGRVIGTQGFAAYMCGQWARARELCDQSEQILRTHCIGASWEIDTVRLFSLWSLHYRGEVAELAARWPTFVKEVRERGNIHMATILNTLLMTTLRLAADDPAGAEDLLHQATGRWMPEGFQVQNNDWFAAEIQIRLYRGDGVDAWKFFATRYTPSFLGSTVARLQRARIIFYERRACCALAAAMGAAGSRPLLRSAERDARRLDREGMAWSKALAYPIRAGIAAARGDTSRAASMFAEALTQLEAVDMNLYAAASRRLGEILGGDEGRAQVERADSWMRQQGIQDPARMADVFAPVGIWS